MKSVVTGCAGFIGSHLTDALLGAGHNVLGIDCFTDYYQRSVKKRNMDNFVSNNNFTFLEKDIININSEILEDIDYVFHLAAQPGVRKSWENFGIYVKNNIIATQHLLQMCANTPIKRFVFASSSSVYGNATPMSETTIPSPISPYGVTKLTCEKLCNLYFSSYNVPVVILRYFSVYGPRQRPDMALSTFISKIMKGERISIFGGGTQTRDFTFVGDVVNATVLSAEKGCTGETINVGSGNPLRLSDAIAAIEEFIGKKAIVEHAESQKGDADNTCADIKKAEKLLGYRQTTGFGDGLKMQVSEMLARKP